MWCEFLIEPTNRSRQWITGQPGWNSPIPGPSTMPWGSLRNLFRVDRRFQTNSLKRILQIPFSIKMITYYSMFLLTLKFHYTGHVWNPTRCVWIIFPVWAGSHAHACPLKICFLGSVGNEVFSTNPWLCKNTFEGPPEINFPHVHAMMHYHWVTLARNYQEGFGLYSRERRD